MSGMANDYPFCNLNLSISISPPQTSCNRQFHCIRKRSMLPIDRSDVPSFNCISRQMFGNEIVLALHLLPSFFYFSFLSHFFSSFSPSELFQRKIEFMGRNSGFADSSILRDANANDNVIGLVTEPRPNCEMEILDERQRQKSI